MSELNEKLAGQAGIKVLGKSPAGEPEGSLWGEIDMTGFALYPGETVARRLCDFPSDLNACFKWLVPKLKEKSSDVCIYFAISEDDTVWTCEIEISRYKGESRAAIEETVAETPALALCVAIEQLIDKEAKDE